MYRREQRPHPAFPNLVCSESQEVRRGRSLPTCPPSPSLPGGGVGGSFMNFPQTGRPSVVLNDRIEIANVRSGLE